MSSWWEAWCNFVKHFCFEEPAPAPKRPFRLYLPPSAAKLEELLPLKTEMIDAPFERVDVRAQRPTVGLNVSRDEAVSDAFRDGPTSSGKRPL
jgi:hypothetical protein